jgi:hypothetical protein
MQYWNGAMGPEQVAGSRECLSIGATTGYMTIWQVTWPGGHASLFQYTVTNYPFLLFFFDWHIHALCLSSYLSDTSLPARIHESPNTCLTCVCFMVNTLLPHTYHMLNVMTLILNEYWQSSSSSVLAFKFKILRLLRMPIARYCLSVELVWVRSKVDS